MVLNKSKRIKNRKFSTRLDYENHLGTEIWSNEELVRKVHKHWHSKGQSGCVFAQSIAKKHVDCSGWKSEIINYNNIKSLDNLIEKSIKQNGCEVLSLLLPTIVNLEKFVEILSNILKESKYLFIEKINYPNEKEVSLPFRVNINSINNPVLSWVMIFGPFESFPNTRQSPIAEICIRVKPKPKNIYSKLNQNKNIAHLADTPFFLKEEIIDKTWIATHKNTEYILGHKPNLKSAAKTSITISNKLFRLYFEKDE
ncbi:hypothetical protein NYT34_02900 [Staphylococcus aureus]|nr:hypothetical protein [Staphylococcus aureus]